MLEALDFYGHGDNRIAVFDWTGLKNLNSPNCSTCSGIQFGGQLFAGVNFSFLYSSVRSQSTDLPKAKLANSRRNDERLLRGHRLHLGLYARVEKNLNTNPSYISLVFARKRRIEGIRNG
jgi:hypothetical protein